jgi:hypothetical protein
LVLATLEPARRLLQARIDSLDGLPPGV